MRLILLRKLPSIGGRMSQLDKTFPTLDCSACILTPKMVEAAAHEKINIYTYSEVEKVSGFVGDFTVDIRKKARSVDMSKCTGCGVCSEKCPSKKNANEFNRGLNNRSAIYIPFAQAIQMFRLLTVRIVSNSKPENAVPAPRFVQQVQSTMSRRMRSLHRNTAQL